MKRLSGPAFRSISGIAASVVVCRRCPRLVKYREGVKPRASFMTEEYWRRPVPGFGDPDAELVVVGLAPAAHGGNRTGRVFTGDASGRFLVRALFQAGFASQPVSESKKDGLVYRNCYVTAAVKCAPPGDRPSNREFENCIPYLDAELELLERARIVLALGNLAMKAVLGIEERRGFSVRGIRFVHGAHYPISGGRLLVACYHPSPRNTNTGKLTQEMLTGLLRNIEQELQGKRA